MSPEEAIIIDWEDPGVFRRIKISELSQEQLKCVHDNAYDLFKVEMLHHASGSVQVNIRRALVKEVEAEGDAEETEYELDDWELVA